MRAGSSAWLERPADNRKVESSNLSRPTKFRATYLKTLAQFVKFTGLSPDELVALKKEEVEEKVQSFCDLARAPRTANRKMEELKTFFMCNRFRTGNKCNLVLERRYVGVRERARPNMFQPRKKSAEF